MSTSKTSLVAGVRRVNYAVGVTTLKDSTVEAVATTIAMRPIVFKTKTLVSVPVSYLPELIQYLQYESGVTTREDLLDLFKCPCGKEGYPYHLKGDADELLLCYCSSCATTK